MLRKTRSALAAAALAVLLSVGAVSCAPEPQDDPAAQVPAHCTSIEDLNQAWNDLLLDAGAGFKKSQLMALDEGPYLARPISTLDAFETDRAMELFGDACVYELQPEAPGFSGQEGWFVVSTEKVSRGELEDAYVSCETSRDRLIDYTATVQGNPELVGGYVEKFSLKLQRLFPDTEFAAFISKCDAAGKDAPTRKR